MYLEILVDQLLPIAEGSYGSDWVLHQDNDILQNFVGIFFHVKIRQFD